MHVFDAQCLLCMVEPPPAYTPAGTVDRDVVEVVWQIQFQDADGSVCMLEPPPRVHGAKPNDNTTVCMLEPPPAYTPAGNVDRDVVEVVWQIKF